MAFPPSDPLARLARSPLPTLAAALAGGAALAAAGLPLGWVLGALLGAAVVGNLLGPSSDGRWARRAGQLVIGTATAAVLTPELLRDLARALPLMVLAAVVANLAALVLVRPFGRIAGVDRTTALLSVLPAGLAEMAGLAQERGARADVVTVTHTIRVTLIVLAVPLAMGATGAVPPPVPDGGSAAALAACLAIAATLALLARRVGMLSPWIVVPLLTGAAFAAAGAQMAAMPAPFVAGAQVAIGAALGARLRIDAFRRLPRTVAAAMASTAALSAVLLGAAAPVVAQCLGLDAVTATLALAPGGLGEMIAAARSLHVAVPAVVGFHFVRSLVTNLAAPWLVGRQGLPPAA